MDLKQIPIRVVGPGSQPLEEDGQALSYIDMPSDMARFQEPQIPEPDAVKGLAGAREAMMWLRSALANHASASEPLLANLGALDEENRELVNQILGEGEVSINYNGVFSARSQESVLAGVWRTFYFDNDEKVVHDILEVADVAHTARVPDGRDRPIDLNFDDVPEGMSNALAILVELQSKCEEYADSGNEHTINLTLLPLSDAELEFLDARLGKGPVDTLSRAYGKCQVSSTLTPNVWWVRFYNSMGVLILNTIEVVDVPEAICAAPEDIGDSAGRLDSILSPYWSDVE